MRERPDFGGEDFDEDAMRRPGEPVCTDCGRSAHRVVKWGLCEDCLDDMLDARAEARWRKRSA